MKKNDNRNYFFSPDSLSNRDEYQVIVKLIKPKCSAIDLGCGDGSLMKKLIDEKQAQIQGIEISDSGINSS